MAQRGQTSTPKAVPVRHPGRWIASAILLVLIAQLLHFLLTAKALHWNVVGEYLFKRPVLDAVPKTLELTAVAMLIGVPLGIAIAIMRLSANPLLSGAAWIYTWFFRGTPVLVQVLFWYASPVVIKSVSLGIPFGPDWFHTDSQTLITQFVAAALGLGLNEAAYMAEIARAGLISVDEGQTEAASALGFSRAQTMRHVVLPQAMRVIIPPTGNETISMLKTTSIVTVIGFVELLTSVQLISARNFQVIPLLIVASIWYLAMTSVLSVGQYYLERRFARGSSRALPPTTYAAMKARLVGLRSSDRTGG